MRVFKTQGMEESAHLLAPLSRHLLVNALYWISYPVRLRMKLLADLKPYIIRSQALEQADKWREHGGVLINQYKRFEDDTHDAVIFCEAPFSLSALRNDGSPIVIYLPPSWTSHEKELARLSPTVELCRKLLRTVQRAGMDQWHKTICDALGFDSAGATAMTDPDLCKHLGVIQQHMMPIRGAVFHGKPNSYFVVTPITCNMPPTDKMLLPMYEAITALPAAHGIHLAFNGELYTTALFWRKQLKALVRCGSITVKERIGFYLLDGVAPDYERIRASHEAAHAALRNVIETVNDAPFLSPATLAAVFPARRVRLQLSDVPEQPAT